MKILKKLSLASVMLSTILNAQIINEIVVNPNGSESNCEFIEIKGLDNGTLIDFYFASVEGDSTAALGTFDFVYDLSASNLGSNGLLVITADDITGLCGDRTWGAPATTVKRDVDLDNGRMENGSTSFLLIYSPSPIIEGTDYDTDNDGILELPGGAIIADSIGWTDTGASDLVYALVELPSTAGGTNDMATRFGLNQSANTLSAWYHGGMIGDTNSLNYNSSQVSVNFPSYGILTPGEENPNDIIFINSFE